MDSYHETSVPTVSKLNTSVFEYVDDLIDPKKQLDVMMLLQCIISSIEIIANLTVVIVFLIHKELRRKIPNRFIINQVSAFG